MTTSVTAADQADNLASALGQVSQTLSIADKSVCVSPLVAVQLPPFLRALRPIMTSLQAGAVSAPEQLAWLLAEEPEVVLEALAIALAELPTDLSDKTAIEAAFAVRRTWLAGQQLDALLELLAAVVEVNADFFIQKVSPLMATAQGRMADLATGSPPSAA